MISSCLCFCPRFDESLWHSVDLEGLTHMGPALQQVLKTGVRRLRCPRSFMEGLHITDTGWVRQTVMLSPDFTPVCTAQAGEGFSSAWFHVQIITMLIFSIFHIVDMNTHTVVYFDSIPHTCLRFSLHQIWLHPLLKIVPTNTVSSCSGNI